MSIEQAHAKIFNGLIQINPDLGEKAADSIARSFFSGFMDKAARLGKEANVHKVADIALDYAKNVFELRNSGKIETKSDIKDLRIKASNSLIEAEANVDINAFDGIDYAIPVKEKPPARNNTVEQETLDGADSPEELSELSQEGIENSADLNKSKAIADSMNPLQELIESGSPKEQFDFLQEFSKILDANKGESGEVSEADLEALKGQVGELVKNYSPEALEKFLKNLSPELNFEFSNYFNKMLKPALEGGKALVEAGAHIDNEFKPDLVKVLVRNINLLGASMEKPDSEADLGRIQAKKEFVATKLVESSKELELKLSQASNYNVKAHFQRTIDSISAELESKGQKLYASDLSLLAKHLDDTKNISQDKQKTDLAAFLQKNSKFALMALPMILGPLASALSMIPIVGKPLAKLAPAVNNMATQFGPYLFSMFISQGGGNDSNEVKDVKDESPVAVS